MATLTEDKLERLLEPFLQTPVPAGPSALRQTTPEELFPKLSAYLDLLLRWNARTNLTAVREPEEVVTRHFGESLFAGRVLASLLPSGAQLLDFGSGAGFPGFPIQLLLPEVQVTLGESQNKKAAFLREACRVLGTGNVWPARVEQMPDGLRFDAVTLRAVDRMEAAMEAARLRVKPSGYLVALAGDGEAGILVPGSTSRFVRVRQL